MATIPYKLEDITSEYSLFLDNQVLTAQQLNEIVHFFEDQQRLSRILLSGVGRVCGFELNWNAGAGVIELSCGVGVTTDGDLSEKDVPGLRLLSGFQAASGVHPNDLAMILYVENFDKAPDICTKLDCDNLGNRQINNIHFLLIKKTDLEDIIIDTDTIYQT